MEVVTALRPLLERETRFLRAKVLDADRWLAKQELDAATVESVQSAQELLDFWRGQWNDHRQDLDFFAVYAAKVMRLELQATEELAAARL